MTGESMNDLIRAATGHTPADDQETMTDAAAQELGYANARHWAMTKDDQPPEAPPRRGEGPANSGQGVAAPDAPDWNNTIRAGARRVLNPHEE